MVRRPLRKKERKVKALLLRGFSRNKIARELDISKSTVYDIADRLTGWGEIALVDGTRKVPVYEDPYAHARIGGDGSSQGDGAVIPAPVLPPVSKGKRCPDGYVDVHLTTGLECKILSAGDFGTIRDPQGYAIGDWEKPKTCKTQTSRSGYIRVFGGDWTFTYREGNKGGRRFTMYPCRACVHVESFDSLEAIREAVIMQRGRYVASILKEHGWQVEPLEPKMENLHYPKELDTLIQFLGDRHEQDPESDIIFDTSPGDPESEMEGETDYDKVRIYANMPSAIKKLEECCRKAADKISELCGKIAELTVRSEVIEKCVETVAGSGSALADAISEHVERQRSEISRIRGIQDETLELVGMNTRNVRSLSESQSGLQSMVRRLLSPERRWSV